MKAIHLAKQSGELRKRGAHLTPALSPERRGSEFELLTQDEIAARLKVTVRTVIRLQHDGVLPVIDLGKAVRFYWPAVISHLISNCTVCRCVPHGPPLRSATGGKAESGNLKFEIALPHPGPLPPAAAGRRGSLIAKGGTQ
jgi:excisionase family DNA binding protein